MTRTQTPPPAPLRGSSRRSRRGFTLIEVGFALTIMSLLLLGASELFLTAARNTVGTSARVQTTLDASNGLQYILINGRHATSFAVPGAAGWQSPRGAASDYRSGAVNAGIQLSYDKRVATQPVLCVTSCTGAGTASVSLYDTTQPTTGQTLWVYRSDADGTPNAASGMYLHATIRPAGATGSASDTNFTLARSIQTTRTDAVSFVAGSDTKNFQVEVVSAAYAGPAQGAVTDESGGSINAAPLTCKSVRLRN